MSGSKSSAPVDSVEPAADQPLSLTIHSQPGPEGLDEAQRTRSGRLRMLLMMAICAAPVLASYFSFYVLQPRGHAYSDLITPTVDIPTQLSLHDLQGRAVAPASLKGQWLLTVVQPGACDAGCDRMLFAQRQLREMLGPERERVDKLWLVPDDSPIKPELQALLSQAGGVTVLRVPPEQLQAWLRPAAGHRLEDHLFLVDPMGRWMMRSPAELDPARFKKDLDRLMKANAGWDRPGR